MKIEIVEEKRGEIERLQREFADQLSVNEILRGTAQGINSAVQRTIPKINKGIKAEYNIKQKYLSRMTRVRPKAYSGSLYAGIEINNAPLPMIAFKPKQNNGDIAVNIHKGKTEIVRNSFIATMTSGHTGVYARGKYVKRQGFIPGKEKTASGKIRITELRTASVFTMGLNPSVAEQAQEFMGNEAIERIHGILTSRAQKAIK